MEQNLAVKRMRVLELKRIEVLKAHYGKDPKVIDEVEDPILDEMDDVWWSMTEEEQDFCRVPGPHHEETLKWLSAESDS